MLYSERLKKIRIDNNYTLEQLGSIIGVNKQVFHHFESEYTIIPIKHLNTLSNYFNVSLDYLFSFTNLKNYDNCRKEVSNEISSKRLKEFRKENHLTQVKLAEILKISKGAIGNYESNRALIATPFLYTICRDYHISADFLLGKIDSPKYLK